MNPAQHSDYTSYTATLWGLRVDAFSAAERTLRMLEDAEITAVIAHRRERTQDSLKAVIEAGRAVEAQQLRADTAKFWCDLAADAFADSYRRDRERARVTA